MEEKNLEEKIERLKEIQKTLENPSSEGGAEGADLVCEGIGLINEYKEYIENNPEMRKVRNRIMNYLEEYMNGSKSNVLIRRIIWKYLARKDVD